MAQNNRSSASESNRFYSSLGRIKYKCVVSGINKKKYEVVPSRSRTSRVRLAVEMLSKDPTHDYCTTSPTRNS